MELLIKLVCEEKKINDKPFKLSVRKFHEEQFYRNKQNCYNLLYCNGFRIMSLKIDTLNKKTDNFIMPSSIEICRSV